MSQYLNIWKLHHTSCANRHRSLNIITLCLTSVQSHLQYPCLDTKCVSLTYYEFIITLCFTNLPMNGKIFLNIVFSFIHVYVLVPVYLCTIWLWVSTEARAYISVYITGMVIVMLYCAVFTSPLALISSNPLKFYLNPLKC